MEFGPGYCLFVGNGGEWEGMFLSPPVAAKGGNKSTSADGKTCQVGISGAPRSVPVYYGVGVFSELIRSVARVYADFGELNVGPRKLVR